MSNSDTIYDVVIVGGGWAGATMAKKLGEAGKKVLVVEAGVGLSSSDRETYMETFFTAMAKVPSSPYEQNYNAPRPSVLDIKNINPDDPVIEYPNNPIKSIKDNGYFVENGPLPFASTNERLAGGTSWHWLGTCLRLVPNDFKLKTKYGVGVDWPIDYDILSPYYDEAEYFIGVAGAVDQQNGNHGITYTEGYNYPMKPIPNTVLDQAFIKALAVEPLLEIDGNVVEVAGTPAGRNGASNKHWKTGEIYDNGRRECQGNTNCTPICPIQAKYDATITLKEALDTGNVDIMYKTVAYDILMDETTKKINGIKYKQYESRKGGQTGEGTVYGKKYVVAAHAIESAKLFLMSNSQMPNGIANSSGQMGKNLMDHPMTVSWGLMPERTYPFRGPLSTSGIESVKDGDYRKKRAAYRIEIGNEGWNWTMGAPYSTVNDFVNTSGVFGAELISSIEDQMTRQFRIGFLIEQTPEESSCIIPSLTLKDNLGIPRPEINYDFSEYTMKGFKASREATKQIFDKLGATDYSVTDAKKIKDPNSGFVWFDFEGETYSFYGAGHIMGTHRMGDAKENSVTNSDLKSWDHDNLYIVGCGSFPTGATSNPTLTLVALALRAADAMIAEMNA
ncbi:MAG: choline dehydrogenase-like flavoprotein [Crocinitomicaceae bacterium]|jgi:choline dehydrogenase-like flavoprotein